VTEPELVVRTSADELAALVARDVVGTIGAVLQRRTRAALALTAGSIMEQVWAALAADPGDIDWARVDMFWGDERFVAQDSPDRNDGPANQILFGAGPIAAAQQYPMPAAGGEFGDDIDAAAAGYARLLGDHLRPDDEGAVPNFDIVLLGVGPDGHCCSLFPDHPSARDLSATVIPVRDSPKPPPLRLSLSFDGLNAANEIWAVVSGTGKADAVRAVLRENPDREHIPSAGARGRLRTRWMVDADAASKLE
jgi:6-phosphogluconolactonase